MTLVIDNYDSFTYNLVQLLEKILVGTNEEILVKRNDQIPIAEIADLDPRRILISPGPGRPEDAGVSVGVIQRFGSSVPILGVCLGHQAIGVAFGGTIVQAPVLMHGMTSSIFHFNTSVFKNVRNPFLATRYHSLVLSSANVPKELEVTATTEEGTVMGIRHRNFPVEGVQFHPESIITEEGEKIVRNWLER